MTGAIRAVDPRAHLRLLHLQQEIDQLQGLLTPLQQINEQLNHSPDQKRISMFNRLFIAANDDQHEAQQRRTQRRDVLYREMNYHYQQILEELSRPLFTQQKDSWENQDIARLMHRTQEIAGELLIRFPKASGELDRRQKGQLASQLQELHDTITRLRSFY